jgi:predicted MFS family arabinose efflux permease
MSSNAMRFVPVQTLSSRVPAPQDRARFLSIQSAVQHIASSVGAFISSLALTTDADKRLIGMPKLASATILLSLVVPFLCYAVERRVRAREQAQAHAGDVHVAEIAHG